MATLVGIGPNSIVGEQGRSFGFASWGALHGDAEATATSNPLDIASAYSAGDITHIGKLGSTTSKLSIFCLLNAGATTITTSPAIYVYGIVPLTEAAREGLNQGVIYGSSGGTYVYHYKRLDARMGQPATTLPVVIAECMSDYNFKTSPTPDALYQLDTQGCEFVVVLIGTAMVGDASVRYIGGSAV